MENYNIVGEFKSPRQIRDFRQLRNEFAKLGVQVARASEGYIATVFNQQEHEYIVRFLKMANGSASLSDIGLRLSFAKEKGIANVQLTKALTPMGRVAKSKTVKDLGDYTPEQVLEQILRMIMAQCSVSQLQNMKRVLHTYGLSLEKENESIKTHPVLPEHEAIPL